MTGVGSSPALATCETNNVLLTGVSSEVQNIFYFISGEGTNEKYMFSLHKQNKGHIKIISIFYSLHTFPLIFVLGNLVFSYALGISRYILPKAISKVVETINLGRLKYSVMKDNNMYCSIKLCDQKRR